MRILEIISDSNIGGAGSVLLTYLRFRDRGEFEVAVAMPRGSLLRDRPEMDGVQVFELENLRDKSLDFPAIRELRGVIKRFRPDVVHTHGAMSGRIAARRENVPAVFTKHSAFPPSRKLTTFPGKQAFRFITLRYAKRIISVSPVCTDGLVACGIPPERIDTILNGAAALAPPENRTELRRKHCPDNVFLMGILARIETYKGQDTVIEAAKILRDRGREFVMLIAGTGSYEREAKELSESLGVKDCVRFLGFCSDVSEVLGILDVQINASRVEACSMSLIEGMSLSLPAVASDTGGNPLLIHEGENGLIYKTGDPRSLADKLERFMDSPELQKKLAEGAKRIYDADFTGERTARETENVYRKTAN